MFFKKMQDHRGLQTGNVVQFWIFCCCICAFHFWKQLEIGQLLKVSMGTDPTGKQLTKGVYEVSWRDDPNWSL